MVGCSDVITGSSQRCSDHCRNSLIALTSTEEGEALMKVMANYLFYSLLRSFILLPKMCIIWFIWWLRCVKFLVLNLWFLEKVQVRWYILSRFKKAYRHLPQCRFTSHSQQYDRVVQVQRLIYYWNNYRVDNRQKSFMCSIDGATVLPNGSVLPIRFVRPLSTITTDSAVPCSPAKSVRCAVKTRFPS